MDNRRWRILTEDEQQRLLTAWPRKLRAVVTLALITAARAGEILALRSAHCQDGYVTFLEMKNGKSRRIPISSTPIDIAKLLGGSGGRQEARTPDLRVANAALSQLS